jgi:hypothetical protein
MALGLCIPILPLITFFSLLRLRAPEANHIFAGAQLQARLARLAQNRYA